MPRAAPGCAEEDAVSSEARRSTERRPAASEPVPRPAAPGRPSRHRSRHRPRHCPRRRTPRAAPHTAPCRTPRRTAAILLLAALLAAGCSGLGAPGPRTRAWAEGPVRWLLLPAELRELRRLRNDAEGNLFVEEFWRRRDPQPGEPGNPVRAAFEARVDIADRAYEEGGLRGSLTDRGHALVLLGPPPLLRHGTRTAPALRPGHHGGGPMPVRSLVIETWEYGPSDLWPALVALLDEHGESGIRLVFQIGDDGCRLIDGDEYLEMAAEATLQLVPQTATLDAGRS